MQMSFGRSNYLQIARRNISLNSHDHVLLYAKPKWTRNLLERTEKSNSNYKNPDNDTRGIWTSSDLSARNYYSLGIYSVTSPSGRVIEAPPPGRYWTISKERFEELNADGRIWWGAKGNNQPRLKRFLSDVREGVVPQTVWRHEEVGHTQEAKKEVIAFNGQEVFATPKPERLIKRVLQIATQPGDLVLNSFAGSGTTGAVAQKMGRRWIMVELGDHAVTHVVPRLKKVIDGDDSGGVTESIGWKGGGGFRFYGLAPSLLEKDQFGNWVISKAYNAVMLAEAMCKHLGFVYAPSHAPAEYWRHGYSTESDFIYITTQSLTYDALKKLSEEVGPKRTLLVCCKAFNAKEDAFENLTVKKIPHAILKQCEWGRDDYSLRVAGLPVTEETDDMAEEASDRPYPSRRGKAEAALPLFEQEASK